MPLAKTDDRVRIHYEGHGRGAPLALAARHRLILWEPRGHARSDSPEDPAKHSFQRWALDLERRGRG